MNDAQISTNDSGQQNLTRQQIQDDIQTLQELKKNLEDEQTEIDQILADAAVQVQQQAGESIKRFDEAIGRLNQLQQQAEQEERAGAIEQARQDIAQSGNQ